MRQWSNGLVFACGLAGMLAQSSFAQEIQILPVQAQPAQILPAQAVPNVLQAKVMIARPGVMPIMQQAQLMQADAVVVGRVVGMEPVDIQAPVMANQPNANYRVAVIQVNEVIHGVKQDTKMVRVGFIAAPMNGDPNGGINGGGGIQIQIQPAIQPVPPNGLIRRPYQGYGNVALQVRAGWAVHPHQASQGKLLPRP